MEVLYRLCKLPSPQPSSFYLGTNTIQCVWLAAELAFVFKFYIETKNTPLEEIAKHFDGDSALVGGADASGKGRILQQEIHEKDRKEAHENVTAHEERVGL